MLRTSGVKLVYDDFGAGQARVLELAEAPSDVLKFDMSLIRDIDSAPPPRQRLVGSEVSREPRQSSALSAAWEQRPGGCKPLAAAG